MICLGGTEVRGLVQAPSCLSMRKLGLGFLGLIRLRKGSKKRVKCEFRYL